MPSQPQLQHVEFPDLEKLLVQILEDIIQGRLETYKKLPYGTSIRERGVLPVANELLKAVRPEARALHGKHVTREALEHVRLQQKADAPWLEEMGYLDYVTDDRDEDYVRNYVGQCALGHRRILSQHAQSILRGTHDSLHYFILWLGNGHRAANFLRLWSFSDTDSSDATEWHQMRTNILEATFCRAFASHHGMLEAIQDTYEGSGLGLGLNIMSPLLQGAALDVGMAVRALSGCTRSSDAQIQY